MDGIHVPRRETFFLEMLDYEGQCLVLYDIEVIHLVVPAEPVILHAMMECMYEDDVTKLLQKEGGRRQT